MHKHRMKRFYRPLGALHRRIRAYSRLDDDEEQDAIDIGSIGSVDRFTTVPTAKMAAGQEAK